MAAVSGLWLPVPWGLPYLTALLGASPAQGSKDIDNARVADHHDHLSQKVVTFSLERY